MKKTVLILVSLLQGCLLFAQDSTVVQFAPDNSVGAWRFTPSVVSQYMFRGIRLGGPSFQPDIEYTKGSLGLGFWSNIPLKDKVAGQSDPKLDVYCYYSMEVANGVSIVPGFSIYTYPNARKANGFYKASYEPNIAFNYSLGAIQITPKFYYDLRLKGATAEVSASFAIPIKNFGTELDFTGTLGTFKWNDSTAASEPKTKNWGDYYLIGIAAPFQFSASSKVTFGWAYTKGSNNYFKQGTAAKTRNTAALGRGVITVSYSYTF